MCNRKFTKTKLYFIATCPWKSGNRVTSINILWRTCLSEIQRLRGESNLSVCFALRHRWERTLLRLGSKKKLVLYGRQRTAVMKKQGNCKYGISGKNTPRYKCSYRAHTAGVPLPHGPGTPLWRRGDRTRGRTPGEGLGEAGVYPGANLTAL